MPALGIPRTFSHDCLQRGKSGTHLDCISLGLADSLKGFAAAADMMMQQHSQIEGVSTLPSLMFSTRFIYQFLLGLCLIG